MSDPTPTTDETSDRRKRSAALLRAVADLIEHHPDLPEPDAKIRFYVPSSHPDVPTALADIVSNLPGPWKTHIDRSSSGEYEWLNFDSPSGGSHSGAQIQVTALAKNACTASGTVTRTVTTWEPLPAVASLIDGKLEQL